MRALKLHGRTIALIAIIVPLVLVFAYVAMRSGPLAPVKVTVVRVQEGTVSPALFGIGTVEARHSYRIGPTLASRVGRVEVQVGDRVRAGQVIGEMDAVDLSDRIRAQEAALKRAQAGIREAEARQAFAQAQSRRYDKLSALQATSEELAITRRQEREIAEAGLIAAREALAGAQSERAALVAQLDNLKLVAPVDGMVTLREAEPGTTVVAGQAVVEVIDPASLWINLRLDQVNAGGLASELPASIVLRSRSGEALPGRVLRVEPKADAVTEELLAKVVFELPPEPVPPIGELAEVTVALPLVQAAAVVPNAALRREAGEVGVWQVKDGRLQFAPLKLGATDLDGRVQVREGLTAGDEIVLYSERALSSGSRIEVVSSLPGAEQ
ncbi:RND family efflux transporter MFP subunit [Thauera humireducens]|uniref:efflux RND transporter periplasmic adaptor subunit n=1 Tax=Thauera humireducens TaxID=1134435 RepID=UPI002467A644|nr:efflux RND transporter periplasmic adaptor subunit [Thauera humireducens]CAH1749481.1 RND family efflux transporter MFP subunit [Thauera humireducens]